MRSPCMLAVTVIIMPSLLAAGNREDLQVVIGGQEIGIPAPKEFREISADSPGMRPFAERLTPPGARLIGIFVSEDDARREMRESTPELRRYAFVASVRGLEGHHFSGSDFLELTRRFKGDHDRLSREERRLIESLLRDGSMHLSEKIDATVELGIEDQVPLGVFLEEKDAIASSSLIRQQVVVSGERRAYLVVAVGAIVRVHGRLLNAHVYSMYEDPGDVEWVRSTSRMWISNVLAANRGEGE